jgi:TonB family protein
MPRRRIAAGNGLFILLALAIWLHPAMAKDSPDCQALELIPPPPQHPPKSPVGIQVEISSTTPGANLGPYLRKVTASISHSLRLRLPESLASGEEGTVVIRVQLRKDGSLSPNDLSVACTSGIKDMDATAQSAIQSAAPFEPVPETYGGSGLVLLFRISYRQVPSNPSRRT